METTVNLYAPLPAKEFNVPLAEHIQRILLLDPSYIYERIKGVLNPLSRYNDAVTFDVLFPQNNNGICDCGCGRPVKGKKRWHSMECMNFATGVWQIINGRTQYIQWILSNYKEPICCKCGNQPCEADHIIPVNGGGGGSWLSNFQFLCKECHKIKTRQDNGWVELKTKRKKKNENPST